jgi:hypothetical protein
MDQPTKRIHFCKQKFVYKVINSSRIVSLWKNWIVTNAAMLVFASKVSVSTAVNARLKQASSNVLVA